MNSCTVYGMLASNDTSGINQDSNIMEYAISTDRKENTENIYMTVSRKNHVTHLNCFLIPVMNQIVHQSLVSTSCTTANPTSI